MAEAVNDTLTERIIGLCYELHRNLGPGFPEKIYHNALIVLLKREHIDYNSEKRFEVYFEGEKVGDFRCDLVIENELILELKAVEGSMPKLFINQMVSYLRVSDFTRGLLINFGNESCVVKRVSNKSKME